MTLEKQVCSLELAQKLKNLGVKQESYFSWVISQDKEKREIVQLRKTDIGIYNNPLYKMYHAYSVAELGEMLPDRVKFDDGTRLLSWLVYEKMGDVHWIKYYRHGAETAHVEHASTEADARAKMLIYLLENNLLK